MRQHIINESLWSKQSIPMNQTEFLEARRKQRLPRINLCPICGENMEQTERAWLTYVENACASGEILNNVFNGK